MFFSVKSLKKQTKTVVRQMFHHLCFCFRLEFLSNFFFLILLYFIRYEMVTNQNITMFFPEQSFFFLSKNLFCTFVCCGRGEYEEMHWGWNAEPMENSIILPKQNFKILHKQTAFVVRVVFHLKLLILLLRTFQIALRVYWLTHGCGDKKKWTKYQQRKNSLLRAPEC